MDIITKPRLAKTLFFFVLPFIVFFWFTPFFSHTTLSNDYELAAITEQLETQFALKTGTYPLYIPGYAGGTTAMALSQAELFHPLPNIAARLPFYWDGKALEWNTLLRLFSLGLVHLLLFWLARYLGLSNAFSFILSFITVYNLRMLNMFRYGMALEGYIAFLILASSCIFYFINAKHFLPILGIIAGSYLSLTSGHPQFSYFSFIGAFIIVLITPIYAREMTPDWLPYLKSFKEYYLKTFAWIAIGALLASAFWVPYFIDFIAENTGRIGSTFEFATSYQSTPVGILNSIMNPWISNVHGSYMGSSLALLAVIMPLAAMFKKGPSPMILFLWCLLILIFVLAMGSNTVLYRFLWEYLPFGSSFRIPGRLLMLSPFITFLILAWALKHPGLGPLSMIAFLLVLIYPFIPYAPLHEAAPFSPVLINGTNIPSWMQPLTWQAGLLTLLCLAIYSSFPKIKKLSAIILIAACILQVTAFFAFSIWVGEKSDMVTYETIAARKTESPLYGWRMGWESDSTLGSPQFADRLQFGHLERRLAWLENRFRNVESANSAYAAIVNKTHKDIVLVEDFTTPPGINPLAEASATPGKINLSYNSFNRFDFKVSAPQPAFLLFGVPYAKHWQAWINGEPTTIYQANGMDQAIWLPKEGDYLVEFRYHSKAVLWGLLLTLFTLSGLMIYFSITVAGGNRRWFWLTVFGLVLVILFVTKPLSFYEGDNLNTQYSWQQRV